MSTQREKYRKRKADEARIARRKSIFYYVLAWIAVLAIVTIYNW